MSDDPKGPITEGTIQNLVDAIEALDPDDIGDLVAAVVAHGAGALATQATAALLATEATLLLLKDPTVKWAFYPAAGDGNVHEVVAAVTGKKIRVLGAIVSATADTVATFYSAATAKSAGFSVAAKANLVLPASRLGYLETVAAEALGVKSTAAAGIHVLYCEV
jgi:hypothetical protein